MVISTTVLLGLFLEDDTHTDTQEVRDEVWKVVPPGCGDAAESRFTSNHWLEGQVCSRESSTAATEVTAAIE